MEFMYSPSIVTPRLKSSVSVVLRTASTRLHLLWVISWRPYEIGTWDRDMEGLGFLKSEVGLGVPAFLASTPALGAMQVVCS